MYPYKIKQFFGCIECIQITFFRRKGYVMYTNVLLFTRIWYFPNGIYRFKWRIDWLPADDWQRLGTCSGTLRALVSAGVGPCLCTVGRKWAPWHPEALADPPALFGFLSGTGSWGDSKSLPETVNYCSNNPLYLYSKEHQKYTHCLLSSLKENNHISEGTSEHIIFLDLRSHPHRKLTYCRFSCKSTKIIFFLI